jgi:hypothetical protein
MNHETMPAQGPVDVNVMHDKGNLTIENHPTCPECGSAEDLRGLVRAYLCR